MIAMNIRHILIYILEHKQFPNILPCMFIIFGVSCIIVNTSDTLYSGIGFLILAIIAYFINKMPYDKDEE